MGSDLCEEQGRLFLAKRHEHWLRGGREQRVPRSGQQAGVAGKQGIGVSGMDWAGGIRRNPKTGAGNERRRGPGALCA